MRTERRDWRSMRTLVVPTVTLAPLAPLPPMITNSHCSRSAASRIDRKSTRLNSSHVATSYAVFCLKKKNKGVFYDTRQEKFIVYTARDLHIQELRQSEKAK